jgi:hypothetical protein
MQKFSVKYWQTKFNNIEDSVMKTAVEMTDVQLFESG